MIVAKFGGTSVADAAAIARLAGIVGRRAADRPVVVVSALAKITDALLGLAPLVQRGEGAALDAALAAMLERHASTARALPGAAAAMPGIESDVAALGRQLAGAHGRALRPVELDAVAGRGDDPGRVWAVAAGRRGHRTRGNRPSGGLECAAHGAAGSDGFRKRRR